jgi:hypothetical protein
MSRLHIICQSCIGLGKIMYAGELRICPRCNGAGRVPAVWRESLGGKFIEIVPDPEDPWAPLTTISQALSP